MLWFRQKLPSSLLPAECFLLKNSNFLLVIEKWLNSINSNIPQLIYTKHILAPYIILDHMVCRNTYTNILTWTTMKYFKSCRRWILGFFHCIWYNFVNESMDKRKWRMGMFISKCTYRFYLIYLDDSQFFN